MQKLIAALFLATSLAAGCASSTPPPAAPASAPAASAAPSSFASMPAEGTEAMCPVSKKPFKVTAQTAHVEHAGKHYVFCCAECKPTFEANPAKFAEN